VHRLAQRGHDGLGFRPLAQEMMAVVDAGAGALSWQQTLPNSKGTQIDFANANTRSAYTRIMQLSEVTAARVTARYEELMQAASAYFATPRPTRELKEALNRSIVEAARAPSGILAVEYAEVPKALCEPAHMRASCKIPRVGGGTFLPLQNASSASDNPSAADQGRCRAFFSFLPLQQQCATRNNAGPTRTCRATAARLSRGRS
jgi:hypothetical protein